MTTLAGHVEWLVPNEPGRIQNWTYRDHRKKSASGYYL